MMANSWKSENCISQNNFVMSAFNNNARFLQPGKGFSNATLIIKYFVCSDSPIPIWSHKYEGFYCNVNH